MKKRSKWKTRGLLAGCLIAGLLVGFGAGFFVQRELREPKAKPATTTKQETTTPKSSSTEPKATAEKSKSSTPESSTPASSAPLVVASTPAQAMSAYMKTKGIDGTNMIFSVVSTSKTDPNWKLDKGTKGTSQPLYFVLHHVAGGWAVVEHGTGLTAQKLSAVGAPADLLTSAVPQ